MNAKPDAADEIAPTCTFEDPTGIKAAADQATDRAGASAERLAAKLETLATTDVVDVLKEHHMLPAVDVHAMIMRVLVREGRDKYTNDPNDPGGPTRWGITLGALARYRKGLVRAEDVQQLTESEAIAIYRRDYFLPGFEQTIEPIAELMFDYSVHAGSGACARAVQTILQRIGYYVDKIDGVYGEKSQEAMAKVHNLEAFFYALKAERYESLLRQTGARPSATMYSVGFSNRLDQFEMKFADAGGTMVNTVA